MFLRLLFVLCFLNTRVFAGMAELTTHSRANCANNESITWEFGKSRMLKTVSIHEHYGPRGVDVRHTHTRLWERTWRSAAVCWGEGAGGGWKVWGTHWIMEKKKQWILARTYAQDCSIYNGWWD